METRQTTQSHDGEERNVSYKNSGVDDTTNASFQNQIDELKRQYVHNRSDAINRGLLVITLILAFLTIAAPVGTWVTAYFTYDQFQDMVSQGKEYLEEAKQYVSQAGGHANQAEGHAGESGKYLEEIKKLRETAYKHVRELTSEDFKYFDEDLDDEDLDKVDAIEKIIKDVERDQGVPLEEKAIAAAYRLQGGDDFTGAIEKWKLIANIADGEDDDLAARAWFSVGFLHLQKHEWEEALSACKKAIDRNRYFARAYNNRGIAKFNLGKYEFDRGNAELAIDYYKSTIDDYDQTINLKHDGDLSLPYSNRAIVNFVLGEYEFNRGNIALAHEYYESAFEDYTQAIDQNPNYPMAYNNRGIVNFTLGKYASAAGSEELAHEYYESAFEDYDKALNLKPGYVDIYANRGNIKVKLGEIKEARLDFQTALGLAKQQGIEDIATKMEQNLQALNDME